MIPEAKGLWQNVAAIPGMKITPARPHEWMAAACAAVSALLMFAAFPPLEWTWAAPFALVPVWGMARRIPSAMALKMGGLAGFLFWLMSIEWLTHVTIAGWILMSAYCALYFLPAAWMANRWRGGPLGFAGALAIIWTGTEFLRGWIGGGFPWNLLGSGVTPWLPAIQVAEFGGVWLVSGCVAFFSALLAWAVAEHCRWRTWGVGMLAAALVPAWGAWRLSRPFPQGDRIRVALVQTSIPQDEKWVQAKIDTIYQRLTDLTVRAQTDPRLELVIWPETALPDEVRSSEPSYTLVWSLCTNGTQILTGSLDAALADDGRPLYFNSAFLFDADGRMIGEYDKRHLVAFGEFIPGHSWIPFDWQMAWGLPLSISEGEGGAVFLAADGRIPLSPLICFEDILPYLARADVRSGARLLVNLTNDAWFDRVMAPRQHMRSAVLRAVENRVPLIRSANTGVTCVIAPSGKVENFLHGKDGETDAPGVLWADVPVPPDGMSLTFFSRFGDMVGIACAVATVLWLLHGLWLRHRNQKKFRQDQQDMQELNAG